MKALRKKKNIGETLEKMRVNIIATVENVDTSQEGENWGWRKKTLWI